MASASDLTLSDLESCVDGGVAAIRSRTRLQPAGGPGDKLFPPTYATGDRTLKYAVETRRLDGSDVTCVLLDSVASQANRMEEALQRAWEEHDLPFPVIAVDFGGDEKLRDLGRISTLVAPHRAFDALLRDSVVDDGTLFRDTDLGRAMTDASWSNATALYRACPTMLVFGGWDSTGPKGGLGTKVQRALASEVVAVHARTGSKVASRIDPAAIERHVTVYHDRDDRDDYTIDPDRALVEKGKPVLFSRKGAEGKGRPSAINHGNVAPSIDEYAGGITCDYAVQTTVLSLPALRRLRFQRTIDGTELEGETRIAAERAARTALAALGLAAMTELRDTGFDLRSRCVLVPEGAFVLELVPADGGEVRSVTLSASRGRQLLVDAHERARELGFGWDREPLTLRPAPKLANLIRASRALAAPGQDEADDAGAD